MYTSRHGFGHAVRSAATLERLVKITPVDLHIRVPAPAPKRPDSLLPYTVSCTEMATDVGVVQSHALEVHLGATRLALEAWQTTVEERTEAEAAWLVRNADVVFADMPPMVFEAARRAGIPAIAHGNFSWDWIYGEMGLDEAAQDAELAYRHANLLIELEPACPMPAFRQRQRVGVLGRSPSAKTTAVRSTLGVGDDKRLVLIAIRGTDARACALPPYDPQVSYIAPDIPLARDDVISGQGIPFLDILGAADLVVAKPGYGIYGDTWAAGVRVLWAPRSGFPEDHILERAFAQRPGTLVLESGQLKSGRWAEALAAILTVEQPRRREAPGGQAAAELVASVLKETAAT